MAKHGSHHFPIVGVPNLDSFVEWSSGDSVSERIIEGETVDGVLVVIEIEQLFACVRVPNLAGSVITASDETVSIFVESTIGQGLYMSFLSFE